MEGGCPGLVVRSQLKEKKPGWRGSPGTPPSAPPPTPLPPPPLHPLAFLARVPVLLRRLHNQRPVHKGHMQPPLLWTQLARAFCKRWYCPDCVAPLLSPFLFLASLPSSLFFLLPSFSLFLCPFFPFFFPYLPTPSTLFLLRRGTVRYL